jgi:DNA-binding response OmpR family regulator
MFPLTSGPDHPRRVLVIEENPASAEALRLLLQAAGHEVCVAHSGFCGVALAREWKPDIVLVDIGLPMLDGFGVAKALRPSGVRLMGMSGCLDAAGHRLAQEAGYEVVLDKPVRPETLLRVLDG